MKKVWKFKKIEKNYKKAVEDQEGWKEKYTNLLRQLEEANPKIQENSYGEYLKQLETDITLKSQLISEFQLKNQKKKSKIQNFKKNYTRI